MRDETLQMLLDAITPYADDGPLAQLRAALFAVVHHIGDEPRRAQILFGDHAGSAVLEQRGARRSRWRWRSSSTSLAPTCAPTSTRWPSGSRCWWASAASSRRCWPGAPARRSGLVEADADELVEHLTNLGAALSPRFLED